MNLDELKRKFDKAYTSNQVTRERSANDLVFYWVTNWDDTLIDTQLAYRGEFDILRKGGRQIMSDLRANPVQPDFHPKDETRTDDAELMDMYYRAVDQQIDSEEAYMNSMQDQVVCGFGAWRVYTEYKSNSVGDLRQVIKREYIPQANNTVFFDPNDNSLSKTDSKYCAVLYSYSEEGYKDLVEELTGERPDTITEADFKQPERDISFFWYGSNKEIYVVRFYEKELMKDTVIFLEDVVGNKLTVNKSSIEDDLEEMLGIGYTITAEKEIKRTRIREYIASGKEILNGDIIDGEREGEIISGDYIPIIPVYGEHVCNIQGQEHWEGVTRLAKDPQRLRNFQMSYLADLLSQSPRRKPIFNPEQIQGFEHMYDISGSDNNYPYLLANSTDANGQPLPSGPVGELPEPTIPQALLAGLAETRQAVSDVVEPGLPQDTADPDLSGKAVHALQRRVDKQSYVYQANMKLAKRTDALCFASIASEILDFPQTITVESSSGERRTVEIMQNVYDIDTGEIKTLNDITNIEFDVYSTIGPAYESQKEQTLEKLTALYQSLPEGAPERNLIMHTLLQIMPGVEMDALRDYSRKQMILQGYRKPETEEELILIEQSREAIQQPDANMVLAQAEMIKGQADVMDAENKQAEIHIKAFDAETKRQKVQIDAAEAGIDIQKKQTEITGNRIDNAIKLRQPVH